MAKERVLTVLVPVKDRDVTSTYVSLAALQAAVPASSSNINNIYKVSSDGTYYRSTKNSVGVGYSYVSVVDREFPYLGEPLEIYDFTYDATRMGPAPTISAQGVMRFAIKDSSGDDITLENLWEQECHVVFNGDVFYLKQIPTSSKSNEDARYRYDLDFVSQDVILERVYIYDVVQPFVSEKPISESSSFSFFGGINELAKRINSSLLKSGLSSLRRKHVDYPNSTGTEVPYLTYEQWNTLNVNPSSLIGTGNVFSDAEECGEFIEDIYEALYGNYNAYLASYVYVTQNGDFVIDGYRCVIGNDKEGKATSSDEKLLSFDKNTVHEALQQFHDTFNLEYYITKEKDQYGDFNGNTLIVVGDCEFDFADVEYILLVSKPDDWDYKYYNYYKLVSGEYVPLSSAETFSANTYYKKDYARNSQQIPVCSSPFDYGVSNELLKKEKNNTTEKIITRITGFGSSENIPWHYPNPSPDGWIKPVYKRNGQILDITVGYPNTESDDRYEKFLKNRIGKCFTRGGLQQIILSQNYSVEFEGNGWAEVEEEGFTKKVINVYYGIDATGATNAKARLKIGALPSSSKCYRISASLFHLHNLNTVVDGVYDSSSTYQNPTQFQSMFMHRDGSVSCELDNIGYFLRISFYIGLPLPISTKYDYEGYHYDSQYLAITQYQSGWVPENFYDKQDLAPYFDYKQGTSILYLYGSGYSTNGQPSGKQTPIVRNKGKQYKDISTGVIYQCYDTAQPQGQPSTDILDGNHKDAYQANPIMGWTEWIDSYFDMDLRVYSDDGWYLNSRKINLSDYGLEEPSYGNNYTEDTLLDTIDFQRLKWITPQQKLMPEVYIKTDGERRFYDAHNYYPLQYGTADTAIGEEQYGAKVRNPIYKEKETYPDDKHYLFENEYVRLTAHEHIEEMDDVKPTIKGIRNYVPVFITESQFNANKTWYYRKNSQGEYMQCGEDSTYVPGTAGSPYSLYYISIRIDVVEEFGYDTTDNDEIWESASDGGIQGEYKHPYFFARLRPLGFNLFDMASQEDMTISMTDGHCGACNFKIGVDENTGKNPVQIWEYNVYGGGTYATKGTMLYARGDLRRHVDTRKIYYDTNGSQSGYIQVDTVSSVSGNGYFENTVYTEEQVEQGFVGTVKQSGKTHFEGDVVTNGKFITSQQDTTENYVWVALMKDAESYGVIMPSARPDYNDSNFNVYIRPKSIQDIHTPSSTPQEEEDKADKFVFTNIRMPQSYLRSAERLLSRKLVAYMFDNNYQKFNFSINFSRIYFEENQEVSDVLNENSVVYVKFNKKTYRQYVSHYSYKSAKDNLPEITLDIKDALTVTMTNIEKRKKSSFLDKVSFKDQINEAMSQVEERMGRRTINKTDDVIISNNIIVRGTGSSLSGLAGQSNVTSELISSMQTDLEVNHFKRSDFKVENGTDLNIGGEVFLPTAYNRWNKMERRKWDVESGQFIDDDTQTFAPAFIDNENNAVVDYMTQFVLLEEEPEDWDYNYNSYYTFERGQYEPINTPVEFQTDTYYRMVDGVVNHRKDLGRTLEWIDL